MTTIKIYSLRCPTTNKVRYVGASSAPDVRFRSHLKVNDNNPAKCAWIKQLQDEGLQPTLEILEEVERSRAGATEKKWADKFTAEGHLLTNSRESWYPVREKPDRKQSILSLGVKVKRLRVQSGLRRQQDLADMTGLNMMTISRIERGVYNPYLTTIYKLADALGVEPHELLKEE